MIWEIFVRFVYNNFVSYGVNRKAYIEISFEGGLVMFIVSKRDFFEMWNRLLFYLYRIVGSEVGYKF